MIAQALRLRPERPRVTRLSRKVLAGGTALALALVSGAVLWALQSNQTARSRAGRTLHDRPSQRGRRTCRVAKGLCRAFRAMCPGLGRLCRAISGVRLWRHKINLDRLRLIPNSNV